MIKGVGLGELLPRCRVLVVKLAVVHVHATRLILAGMRMKQPSWLLARLARNQLVPLKPRQLRNNTKKMASCAPVAWLVVY